MTDKQIIIDDVDVSGCWYIDRDNDWCDLCMTSCVKGTKHCYYKQLKRKEQECEEKDKNIKFLLEKLDLSNNRIQDCEIHWEKEKKNLKQQLDQLKSELKSAKELREYTYDYCKQAGEELAKNSFEWDGKEKNLVVQAMELNERYDQLKVENGYLKHKVSQYENLLKLDFTKCRTAEEEVEHANYLRVQGAVILTEENSKLKQTLAEIREIAEACQTPTNCKDYCQFYDKCVDGGLPLILQKISGLEVSKLKRCFSDDYERYKKVLEEIKPILEYYANSKIGEEQLDGTYKIIMSGGCVMAYDPRPAIEGLKKISECEVEDGV